MLFKSCGWQIISIRIVFAILSFLGCFWHLCNITQLYIKYKTNVHVQFEQEIRVELPAVTICTNVSHVLRTEYLYQRFGVNDTNSTVDLTQRLRSLPLREQLLNATINEEQFFECEVMKPIGLESQYPGDYVQCRDVVKIQESIDYKRKCFTIAAQLNGEPNDRYRVDHDVTLQDNSFPLYYINLNRVHSDDLLLFLHSRRQPFYGYAGGLTGIRMNFRRWRSKAVTYSKTTTKLLPSPYETDCLNYTKFDKLGYITQSHCLVKCKTESFQKQFGGWYNDIPYNAENDPDIGFVDPELTKNRTSDKIISKDCSKVCPKNQNCFNEYFTPNVLAKWERGGRNRSVDRVFIYLPSGLNTRYTHTPHLHLIEYICYTASIFSLWFGISMTTISKAFVLFFDYSKNKKKRKISINSIIKTWKMP